MSPKLKNITAREFVRALERDGFIFKSASRSWMPAMSCIGVGGKGGETREQNQDYGAISHGG